MPGSEEPRVCHPALRHRATQFHAVRCQSSRLSSSSGGVGRRPLHSALRLRRAPVPLVRQRFGSRCNVHLYPLQTVPASHAAAVQPRPPYSYKPTIHCRVRRPPASSRKSSIPTVRQPKPTASPPLRPRTSRSSPHRYQLPSKRLRLHHLIPAPLVDDVALVASPCSMRDSPTHS